MNCNLRGVSGCVCVFPTHGHLFQTKQCIYFSTFDILQRFQRSGPCHISKVTLQIRSWYIIWRDYWSLDWKDKTSNLRTGNVMLLNLQDIDCKLQLIINRVANNASFQSQYSESIGNKENNLNDPISHEGNALNQMKQVLSVSYYCKSAYLPLTHPRLRSCACHL